MKKQQIKIGVIAGTPIDTQMGVDFISQKGFQAIGESTASSPKEQNLLQFLGPKKLTQKVISIIKDYEKQKITRTMIYCNSLSAAIDIELIKKSVPRTKLVTPLDIYEKLAKQYSKITLWAANGQCLSAIEKIFYEENPGIEIMGISMLPVIESIENLEPSVSIIKKFDLKSMFVNSFRPAALVLGCTHLPYLKSVLKDECDFPIIDPAEEMLLYLISN